VGNIKTAGPLYVFAVNVTLSC